MESEIISRLRKAVIQGSEWATRRICKEAFEAGLGSELIVKEGLMKGVEDICIKFWEGQEFLPSLYTALLAAKVGFKTLGEYFIKEIPQRGTIVIGTVKGDIHELGRKLVSILLENAGFTIIDLGYDVPVEKFIDAAELANANIIGLSTTMTTSRPETKLLMDELKKRGLRNKYKIIVGGIATDQNWAEKIGADAYAHDAFDALRLVEKLKCRAA